MELSHILSESLCETSQGRLKLQGVKIMADKEKKPLEIENLEVAELEDEDLEDVAGGDNTACNTNCPCVNPQLDQTQS
jgi:hypothetical protein